jgi:hypothetical protein
MGTTRLSRTERRKRVAVLGERDYQVLYTIGRFGGLASSRHLAELYFGGVANTAHKRLRALFDAGYVQAHVVLGSKAPTLYTMTDRGRNALLHRFDVEGEIRPSPRVLDVADLQHRLAILDVRVAWILATRGRSTVKLSRFATGSDVPPLMQSAGVSSLVPDALVQVDVHGRQRVLALEVDLGTESLGVWDHKARRYADAVSRRVSMLSDVVWRLLIVAPGLARLTAIDERCAKVLPRDRFVLLALDGVTPRRLVDLATTGENDPSPNAAPFLAGKTNDSR